MSATRPRRQQAGVRVVAGAVACALVLLAAEIGGVVAWREHRDRVLEVSSFRLDGAAQTFRQAPRRGGSATVDAKALDPALSVRTDPASCGPLTVLSRGNALDGESWTGINGTPAQPVTLLTVRYADAATARHELRVKQLALLRCRTVRLTFPPFTKPASDYTVSGRWPPYSLVGDRMSYALTGDGRRYDFYVRRYVNTLTWTYGNDVATPAVRREVADSLVARLQELARE